MSPRLNNQEETGPGEPFAAGKRGLEAAGRANAFAPGTGRAQEARATTPTGARTSCAPAHPAAAVYDRGMTDPKDFPPPPKATGADTLHAVARAGIGAVPVVGGPALELLARLFSSPIERRRELWFEGVHSAIADLHARGVDVAALRDNDDFCNLVLDTTAAAMRTHREEKRKALRNAITNAGLRGTSGDTRTRVFLRLVDELDVHHLLLLQLLADPAAFLKVRNLPFPGPAPDPYTERDALTTHQSPRSLLSIMKNVLGDALPYELRDIAFEDLVRRGMVDRETKFGTLCIAGKTLASPLGCEFVRFIGEPVLLQAEG